MFNNTTRVTACKCEVNCSVNCILYSCWRQRSTTADYALLQVTRRCCQTWCKHGRRIFGFIFLKCHKTLRCLARPPVCLLSSRCRGSRRCFSLFFTQLENFVQHHRETLQVLSLRSIRLDFKILVRRSSEERCCSFF